MAHASPQHKNGSRWRALRARVLASEDTCGICGQLVDKTLPHLDPGAPQVDHIVPISRGGDPFARANVRLSHRQAGATVHGRRLCRLRATGPAATGDG